MNRVELLISFSNNVGIHRRMWEAEWNRRNKFDISYNQFLVLDMLENEGPKQAKHLVQRFLITSGGVTTITNRLEAQGLVERGREGNPDRRTTVLAITDKGRELLSALTEIRQELFLHMFAKLTDAEIAFLAQIYATLVKGGRE